MFKDLFPPGLFPNQKHNVVPDRGFKGVESDYPATTQLFCSVWDWWRLRGTWCKERGG